MDILAEIQQRLQKCPAARCEVRADTLSVFPASDAGFTVSVTANGGNYTVYYNGWHEEFTDAAEALDCFAFGLSGDCRLQEWRRGVGAYKWTAQYRKGDEWIDESTTGLVVSPFWKRPVVVYLQNHLLANAETGDA